MLLTIKVTTRSSENKLIPLGDNLYKAKLTAAPVDNAANLLLIKLVSEEFGVAKSKIKIIGGLHHKTKIIQFN